MSASDVPLERLFRYLPDLPELRALRDGIAVASAPDPSQAWSTSGSYATLDKRVISGERLAEVVRSSSESARRRVDRLYGTLESLLTAAIGGDRIAAVEGLLEAGDAEARQEEWAAAAAYYEVARTWAETLPERRRLVPVLRRLARARWSLGDVEAAATQYRRAMEQAEALGDRQAEIVSATGLGNMRARQGRWDEAHELYEAALERCGEKDGRLRGPLCTNLAMVCADRGELDEGERWLERALAYWDEMEKDDQCAWLNNQGLIFMDRGDSSRAEAAFRETLRQATTRFDRAMVLDNLAEAALRGGRIEEAGGLARQAEEQALGASSPYALAEVYTLLGKICRAAAQPNGVTFFEKALEICRQRPYAFLEAQAYLEYAAFRQALGEPEEAAAYFGRARALFGSLGVSDAYVATALARASAGGDEPHGNSLPDPA